VAKRSITFIRSIIVTSPAPFAAIDELDAQWPKGRNQSGWIDRFAALLIESWDLFAQVTDTVSGWPISKSASRSPLIDMGFSTARRTIFAHG